MAEKQIGEVTNYFKNVNAAVIKLSAPLKIGDKIKIKRGGGVYLKRFFKS